MGCGKGEQPMLGEVGVRPAVNHAEPSASFHPLFGGRQHAFRPRRRFGPGPAGPDLSRWRSPVGHSHAGRVRRRVHHASTFLRPFARRALPRVVATMDALTPGRVSRPAQVSLLHVHGLRDHSASNHPVSHRRSFRTLPLSPTALPPSHCVGGSRLRHSLAGSPGTRSRIEFVILRTGRSPPAASHPASRRRSCSRLQAGERMPGGDSHPSDHARSQAH